MSQCVYYTTDCPACSLRLQEKYPQGQSIWADGIILSYDCAPLGTAGESFLSQASYGGPGVQLRLAQSLPQPCPGCIESGWSNVVVSPLPEPTATALLLVGAIVLAIMMERKPRGEE